MILQNIESKRTKLNEDLADSISIKTGVKLGWLLDNDLSAPIVARDGTSYTVEHFTYAQATAGVEVDTLTNFPEELFGVFARVYGLLIKTVQPLGPQTRLSRYKLNRALRDLEEEFGCDGVISAQIVELGANEVGKRLASHLLAMVSNPNGLAWFNEALDTFRRDEQSDRQWLASEAASGMPAGKLQLQRRIEDRAESRRNAQRTDKHSKRDDQSSTSKPPH